jgi:hypothetical protein
METDCQVSTTKMAILVFVLGKNEMINKDLGDRKGLVLKSYMEKDKRTFKGY